MHRTRRPVQKLTVGASRATVTPGGARPHGVSNVQLVTFGRSVTTGRGHGQGTQQRASKLLTRPATGSLRVTDWVVAAKGRQMSGSALAGKATGTQVKVPFGALSTGLRATWGRACDKLCGNKSRLAHSFRSPQLGHSWVRIRGESCRGAKANHIYTTNWKALFCF